MRFGEKLIHAGLIDGGQRDEALELQAETGLRIGEAILELGHISERDFLKALAREMKTQFVTTEKLRGMSFPKDLLRFIPLPLAQKHLLFPLVVVDEKTLGVVCSELQDDATVENIQIMSGFSSIKLFLSPSLTVKALIKRHYLNEEDAFDQLEQQRKERSGPVAYAKKRAPAPMIVTPDFTTVEPSSIKPMETPDKEKETLPETPVVPPELLREPEPAPEPVPAPEQPEPKPAPEPAPKPAPQPAPKPAPQPAPKPAPQAASDKPANALGKIATKKAARSVPEEKLAVWQKPQKPAPATHQPPARKPKGTTGLHAKPAAIDSVLIKLVEHDGSDLHLVSGQPPLIRKDGDIVGIPSMKGQLTADTIYQWLAEIAPDHVREAYDAHGDADFAHEVHDVARFRVNWFRDINGVGGVMRTIPAKVPTMEQLGFPPVFKTFCDLPKGLVLVTGPTGSGKSTTMAAMVDYINKTKRQHIITIEDPVEFVHKSKGCLINQREVHTHTESFAVALRAALREDPDIVLVGEMRDLETVHIAIETAETGHLVFGTLHTSTAASTVDRIIDQFPTDQQAQIRVMLSESLKGVISQNLCKKLGGGRMACLEILVVNAAVANLIREGKTFQIKSIMQTAKSVGMQTQADAMLELVQSRQVSPAEAIAKAVDQTNLAVMLEKAGFNPLSTD